MKKITSFTVMAMLGTVLGFGLPAYADQGDCGSGHRHMHSERHNPGAHFARLAEKLDLTDEQKAQLKSWREEKQAPRGERRDALREAHREMQALMSAETIDEAAIHAKARELADAHADSAIEHARFMQRFRAILTPEQLEKLEALKAERPGFNKKEISRSGSGAGSDSDPDSGELM